MTRRKHFSPRAAERLLDKAQAEWEAKFRSECKANWTPEVCRADTERCDQANVRWWRKQSGFLTDDEIVAALAKANTTTEAADIIVSIYMRQATFVSRAKKQRTPNFKRTVRRFAEGLSQENESVFRMAGARLHDIANKIPNGEGGRPPSYEATIVRIHAPIIDAVLHEPEFQFKLQEQGKTALSRLDPGQGARSSFRGVSAPKLSDGVMFLRDLLMEAYPEADRDALERAIRDYRNRTPEQGSN